MLGSEATKCRSAGLPNQGGQPAAGPVDGVQGAYLQVAVGQVELPLCLVIVHLHQDAPGDQGGIVSGAMDQASAPSDARRQ